MAAPISGNTTTREARMRVGSYQIEGVLGEGGSAIVFEATDASGRAIALKVLRPDLALSAKEQQRFVDEASRLRRVQHPSIVEILDSGTLPDGRPFIAMPRLRGQSLLARLQSRPLRFDLALVLFKQLADALHTLHQAGLVHRDIKPENVFVVEGDARALLLDLGIARDMGADPTTTTRAGLIRGTPAYMAPERFFGKAATPATDIYELAVVFYVVLVGALPWNAVDDPTERLRPIPPAQRGVVLPQLLCDTLMRALAGQAQDRPRSTDEFGAALLDAVSPASAASIGAHQTTSVRPTTQPLTAVPAATAPPASAVSARTASSASPRVVAPTIMAAATPFRTPVEPSQPYAQAPAAWPRTLPPAAPPFSGNYGPMVAPPSAGPNRSLMPIVAVFAALTAGLAIVFTVFVFAKTGLAARATTPGAEPPASGLFGTKASNDLRCCRALNEAICPAPPAPCKPPLDVERLLRETPSFALEQIDANCCKSLDSIAKSRPKGK